MSGSPPAWMDDAPPADPDAYGSGGGVPRADGAKKPGGRSGPPAMTTEQAATAVADFYEWLTARETHAQLRTVLPDHVDLEVFLTTAKTAVLNKPDLARDSLRPSLLMAVMKAASQGLLPDGKQGALVPRYNSERKCQEVAWQPMVWGIVKLGRETGAIQSIRAVIVFHGETFRVIQGDEDRIEHEVDIDIADEAYEALRGGADQWGNPKSKPDEFFARVRAAYCVITGTDGLVTKRWMTRGRLSSLREASKASSGPWASRWIDEMICKGMILFTTKWLNLDPASATAQRFRAALMTDLEVDFDREGRVAAIGQDEKPAQAALPAPDAKLDALEQQIFGGLTDAMLTTKETVPVEPSGESLAPAPGTQGGGSATGAPSPDPTVTERAGAPDADRSMSSVRSAARSPAAADGATVTQAGGAPQTASPADPPKTWPSIQAWAKDMRLAIESLPTIEAVEVFQTEDGFAARLARAREKAIKIAQEIEDAIEDRKTWLVSKSTIERQGAAA